MYDSNPGLSLRQKYPYPLHYTNEDKLPGTVNFNIFIELPITINKS